MRCHEIMKTNIATSWIYDSLRTIALRMRARDVGFLPVCNDRGEVVGTITDRDLVIRAMADQLSYDVPVHFVMSTPPIACHADDDINRVEALMRRHMKSRMLVVDDYGRPIGVISLSDIADAEYAWRAGRVFRDVTARERHAQ